MKLHAGIFEIPLETRQGAEPLFELGSLAHDLLRGVGIVPEGGVFDLGVEFG